MTQYKKDKTLYRCPWFSNWFKETLNKRKISVGEFSEMSGLGESIIMDYRCGVRSPSLKTFLLIADTLGYEVNLNEKGATE